jgi:endonuclease YncB( thermonuclease family)
MPRLRTVWSGFRSLPRWMQAVAVVLVVSVASLVGGASTDAPSDEAVAASVRGAAAGDERSTDDDATEEPSVADSAAAVPAPTDAVRPSPSAAPSEPTGATASGWVVTNVVDGDTVDVRGPDGREERVRVVGIDTPERGQCGFAEASDALADLVLGQNVELVAGAQDDRDRYGRLLRYVDVDDIDAGLSLIEAGFAIARYDSRDGYGRHPREDAYVAAAADSTPFTCTAAAAPEPDPEPEPEPVTPEPRPAPEAPLVANPWGTGSCHAAYDPCVPPPSEVGDLDCPDIRARYRGGVRVDHAHGDPHRLDGDEDGHGCD